MSTNFHFELRQYYSHIYVRWYFDLILSLVSLFFYPIKCWIQNKDNKIINITSFFNLVMLKLFWVFLTVLLFPIVEHKDWLPFYTGHTRTQIGSNWKYHLQHITVIKLFKGRQLQMHVMGVNKSICYSLILSFFVEKFICYVRNNHTTMIELITFCSETSSIIRPS